jgi:hypothetical protein
MTLAGLAGAAVIAVVVLMHLGAIALAVRALLTRIARRGADANRESAARARR